MIPPEGDIPGSLVLEATPSGLELRSASERPGQGIRAELTAVHRGNHPLARAVRGVAGPVIDATGGLGGDAAVLAALGRELLVFERHPDLFRMLEDAHARLEDRALADRIHLRRGDACEMLPSLSGAFSRPAAIVLDPMYPVRRSASALPPKAMQLLRRLLAGTAEPDQTTRLVEAAFATAARRVVLKRPPEADPPAEVGKPTFSLESKLVRWDVWERGPRSKER